jgi:alpha-maltose-1-phosphate synthase
MTVLVSHLTGNPNARAVLRGLERHGLSPVFFTTLAISQGMVEKLSVSPRLAIELGRRVFAELPPSRIMTMPWRELARQITRRVGLSSLSRHETGWASCDAVYRALDRYVARALQRGTIRPRLVYAYEDGALETFRESNRQGISTVYELPLTYWRVTHQILGEERELRPAWASTLDALRDSPAKLHRKDLELALGDAVVVPSRFVAESLVLAPERPKRIEIFHYGVASPVDAPVTERGEHEPMRVLYAGQLTQRKGLAYLFEALSRFEYPYELSLAGPLPTTPCDALEVALGKPNHRWLGMLPHARLLKEMMRNHVFIFPSLAEGFGLVVTEALSAGLPVITTTNTCGPEIMTDGVEGFIIRTREPSTDSPNRALALWYFTHCGNSAGANSPGTKVPFAGPWCLPSLCSSYIRGYCSQMGVPRPTRIFLLFTGSDCAWILPFGMDAGRDSTEGMVRSVVGCRSFHLPDIPFRLHVERVVP